MYSGRPAGRPPKSLSTPRKRFRALCEEMLHGDVGPDGLSVFQRAIKTLLAPIIEHGPKDRPCEACGRYASDYLVNGRTISDTLFRLAAYAHGQPPAKVEVGVAGLELTPEQARAQFAQLVGVVFKRGPKLIEATATDEEPVQ